MANDVDYYNKEIIKKKQRNNKECIEKQVISLCSSSGLVAYAPQVKSPEGLLSERGQEEAEPDFSLRSNQAPTSPNDLIKPLHVKRAVVQYYQNTHSKQLQKHKLKIRLNCDFGDGEENVEFIAALTQDLGNFKKYHPECSRDYMQQWTEGTRQTIKKAYGVKAYMGKFHNNNGWKQQGSQVNQIEPWTAVLVYYNRDTRSYWAVVRIYQWEDVFELGTDSITAKQTLSNLKAQKLWYNPMYLNLTRPKTWAEKRGFV
jgi:hypothetical protein